MNSWTKAMLSLSLICYLAVSSIAAAHAFPTLINSSTSPQNIINPVDNESLDGITALEIAPDCHQEPSDSPKNASSVCKIFCAAMAGVMSNHLLLDLPSTIGATEVAFVVKGFHTREPALEPQPPK